MLEYNNQYETHPLYNHFKSWIDMEENYQDSYFIINTALYSAESYIYNTYNIVTRATKVHEFIGDVTEDTFYSRFALRNLLGVYTTDGYVLPSLVYYDVDNKTYTTSSGPFNISDSTLYDVSASNINIEYITGYTYPDNAVGTSVVPLDTSSVGDEVTRPELFNKDGAPLQSPLSTVNQYFDIQVIGDAGSTLYVNDSMAELLDVYGVAITEPINPTYIINEDRIGKITLTLVDGLNTFNIYAVDDVGNKSEDITIVINKQPSFIDTEVQLLGKDLVTTTGDYKILVSSTVGSTILVDGNIVLSNSTGKDVIELNTTAVGVNTISIVVTTPSGISSNPMVTSILFDPSISEEQANAANSLGTNNTTMPQDMLMAILMIAHHYFRIALYKHEDTHSYGDNVSNRTTFTTDRFPKEAHRILSQYVRY